MKRYFPWLISGALAVWVLTSLRPRREHSPFDTAGFGRLPALLNGRVQPLDSVARNALLVMRGRQSVALEGRVKLSATEWLMEVTMKPEAADDRKSFRVDHPDLLGMLKLPASGAHFFSWNELKDSFENIENQARRASGVESQARNTFEKAVIKLHFALTIYHRLKNSLRPETSDNFTAELAEFQQAIGPGVAAVKRREAGQDFNQQDFDRILRLLQRYEVAANSAYPMIIPPVHPDMGRDAWASVGASLMDTVHSGEIQPAVLRYAALVTAYRQSRPDDFNRALGEYQQWLGESFAREAKKGRREFFFHRWQPFYQSTVLYLCVFLLGCASWFTWARTFSRTGFYVLALAFVVHTAGILFRMILEGRPPVTNLYSSAIFVGWGAVLLGLVLERFYRDSIGLVMASALGFITQVIAHNISLDGDTMEMLRAVLDTNFWLATHVVAITLGYSATFVAGFLAIVYIVRGLFTRGLDAPTAEALTRMVYGIVCFATLFSFVGTILGGIWADQSWGRFWGWDPKENGALIIVLWNAIILHARWGGLVRERGLMNLAIFGNIVTSFSWFGVNMLGVGLHAYGFMDKAFYWLMLFVASQVVLIGLGLLPEQYWASLRARAAAAAAAPAAQRRAPRAA